MIQAQLDTSVLIGIIIAIIIGVVGLIASAGVGFYFRSWSSAIVSGVATALCVVLTLFLVLFPFGYAYNHYVPVSGTVSHINSRFIGDGQGGTTQFFVVWIGNSPYKCDDSRCGGLHSGSQVTLLCEKEFQFNAPTQGFVCNWGKLGLNV